jgi:predicted CXXCH cytochrome family protein
MNRAWAIVAAALVAGLLADPAPSAGAPHVHYPPEDLIVTGGGTLHVIVEAPEPGPHTMSIRLNGAEPGPAVSAAGGRVLHGPVQLAPGPNALEIVLSNERGETTTLSRRAFWASPVLARADPPAGFRRQPFHGEGHEAPCAGCHQTQPRPEDAGPTEPRQSTCFSCHARITGAREVHGPAAQWACTRCHDPTAAPVRYATPEPVMPLCFSCHAEQRDRFYGNRYQHGPTATGFCTICHNPHGTEHRFFLKKATWDLCTTCHAEKASGRHVISWGPRGQTHPTRGRPDPSRPGREVSCASCHNPHAAPSPKLWNFKATFYVELCRNCHGGLIGQ